MSFLVFNAPNDGVFYPAHHRSHSAQDWRADLMAWAEIALRGAAQLEARDPRDDWRLRESTAKLRKAMHEASGGDADRIRAEIASSCGYLHSTASFLHEEWIPPHENEAHAAALDIDRAALHILAAMRGDYGHIGTVR